jgi:hypothetical protein
LPSSLGLELVSTVREEIALYLALYHVVEVAAVAVVSPISLVAMWPQMEQMSAQIDRWELAGIRHDAHLIGEMAGCLPSEPTQVMFESVIPPAVPRCELSARAEVAGGILCELCSG